MLELLDRDDLLVFNDTLVIKARLFGHKSSGGKVEVLVERAPESTLALALVRTSHKPAPGSRFVFDAGVEATVEGRRDDFFELRFNRDVLTVLDGQGHVPLPPYITHPDGAVDAERYQTVYATRPGAVAAPTAGLHFTPDLLSSLHTRGIGQVRLTLHVGAGTFQPVRSERLAAHRMIYLAFRFEWKFSVAAIVANLHDVVLVVGVFAIFRWEFSLPVLAAVLAVLGYSVNESVIIFDRVREHFKKFRKMTTVEVIDSAITATISRTIITHGCTLAMTLAMFFFGGPALHYFALALTIGIVFGIYSSVFVAAAIAMYLGVKREDLVKAVKKEDEQQVLP